MSQGSPAGPSPNQLAYATSLAAELGIALPEDAAERRDACDAFISFARKEKKNRRDFRRLTDPGDDDLILSPSIRTAIRSSRNWGEALATLKEALRKSPSWLPVPKQPAAGTIHYWLESLERTAFDSLAKLDSLLPGSPLKPEEVRVALKARPCKNLGDRKPIRHLILRLDPPGREESNYDTKPQPYVIAVLPLEAAFTGEDEANQEAFSRLGYRWQRPARELPAFNAAWLGETGELGLVHREALARLVEEAVSRDDTAEPDRNLDAWLGFFDACFDALTGESGGMAGWCARFLKQRLEVPKFKRRVPVLALVEGGAARGATFQIRRCYRHLLDDAGLLLSPPLHLFRRASLGKDAPGPGEYVPGTRRGHSAHLTRYFGHMDTRGADGQRRAYPLDPAQRDALVAMAEVPDGELLAVNGPPGTGKTSLLRAVIASEWIKPLLSSEDWPECPVVVACAATNQAVTNVISGFGEVPEISVFDGQGERRAGEPVTPNHRWVPYLCSYGWYMPAALDTDKDALRATFQVIQAPPRTDAGWTFHFAAKRWGAVTAAGAESAFLECARLSLGCELLTLEQASARLRSEVTGLARRFERLQHRVEAWFNALDSLCSVPDLSAEQMAEQAECFEQCALWDDPAGSHVSLQQDIDWTRRQIHELSEVKGRLAAETSEALLTRFRRALERVLYWQDDEARWEDIRRALRNYGVAVQEGPPDIPKWMDAIGGRIEVLQAELGAQLTEHGLALARIVPVRQRLATLESLRQARADALRAEQEARQSMLETLAGLISPEQDKEGWEKLRHHLLEASRRAGRGDVIPESRQMHRVAVVAALQNLLDRHVRPRLFHLTARYWEARHIMERKWLDQRRETLRDAGPSSREQIRALAMLAPVFVVTAHSLPKLMKRAPLGLGPGDFDVPYLFGDADLLIVDEAGQGLPEIGACAFAFARRAIVVGDIRQLEPVWSVAEPMDRMAVVKHGLAGLMATSKGSDAYGELKERGILTATGSVMRMAQKATFWADPAFPDAPGLTLTNHYRCRAPIIDISNRLVYRGTLKVVRAATEPKIAWRAPLGFLVAEGAAVRLSGGSRCNRPEAERIARWLKEQRGPLIAHYNRNRVPDDARLDLPELVAVITPFKGQITVLKEEIAKALGENQSNKEALANRMVIGTVHALQGAERPVVVFSMVDTGQPAVEQFYDQGTNLINVAVSRAKEVLVVVMDQAAVDYARKLESHQLRKPSDHLWHSVVHQGERLDSRRLVLIESPNKARHIEVALAQGLELEIVATHGHLTELDRGEGWDPKTASEPRWASPSNKEAEVYRRVATLWPDLEALYIATDSDAEGECIGWHFFNRVQGFLPPVDAGKGKPGPLIKRMRLYRLTLDAIRDAYENAGDGFDAGLIKSALARTLLDQLIARHYPHRLGLGPPNCLQSGVGRVQLAILDLVRQAQQQNPRYMVRATARTLAGQEVQFHASVISQGGPPEPGEWDIREREAAAKVVQEWRERLVSQDSAKLSWSARIEQLAEYPAINTGRFLALAMRATGLPPERIMACLQALYEGQTELPPPGDTR
jgi:antitoxin (DNA-binding transcriptional repressor) of toxin-antitoxin stability system